jgi:hypothetical protein
MIAAKLPFDLQLPLTGVLLALGTWLLLDRLGRRCRSGSLGRALLLSGRVSLAGTVLLSSAGWWLAGLEVRNLLLTIGLIWTLLRWRGELKQRAEDYAAQLLPHLSGKDQLFLFDVLDKLLTTAALLVVLVMGLDLLGVSAGVLITAGGFGAAALGFGARTIVENGLSGLSLYINRPFVLGDSIGLPGLNLLGTVEQVGWFYTELRDLERQRIYVPNNPKPGPDRQPPHLDRIWPQLRRPGARRHDHPKPGATPLKLARPRPGQGSASPLRWLRRVQPPAAPALLRRQQRYPRCLGPAAASPAVDRRGGGAGRWLDALPHQAAHTSSGCNGSPLNGPCTWDVIQPP